MLIDGAFRVLALLSAVNGLYFTSIQFKRMRAHDASMRVAPAGLPERLDGLFDADASKAALGLRDLVEETKARSCAWKCPGWRRTCPGAALMRARVLHAIDGEEFRSPILSASRIGAKSTVSGDRETFGVAFK